MTNTSTSPLLRNMDIPSHLFYNNDNPRNHINVIEGSNTDSMCTMSNSSTSPNPSSSSSRKRGRGAMQQRSTTEEEESSTMTMDMDTSPPEMASDQMQQQNDGYLHKPQQSSHQQEKERRTKKRRKELPSTTSKRKTNKRTSKKGKEGGEKMSAEDKEEAEDRRRASVACLECKKGHAKCGFERINGKCARCARLGLPCTVPTVRKKRGPMSRKEREELKKIIQPLAQEHQPLLETFTNAKQESAVPPPPSQDNVSSWEKSVPTEHNNRGKINQQQQQQQQKSNQEDNTVQSTLQSKEASHLLDRLTAEYSRFRERCVPLKEWQQQMEPCADLKRKVCCRKKRSSTNARKVDQKYGYSTYGSVDNGDAMILDDMTVFATDNLPCEHPDGICVHEDQQVRAEMNSTSWNKAQQHQHQLQQQHQNGGAIGDIEDLAFGLFGCENCTCMHNINNTCELFVEQFVFNNGQSTTAEQMTKNDENETILDILDANSVDNSDITSTSSNNRNDGSSYEIDIHNACHSHSLRDPLEELGSMLSRPAVSHQPQSHISTNASATTGHPHQNLDAHCTDERGDMMQVLMELTPQDNNLGGFGFQQQRPQQPFHMATGTSPFSGMHHYPQQRQQQLLHDPTTLLWGPSQSHML